MFLFKIIAVISPWPLKRLILKHIFKYKIHDSARIGLSWIFPQELIMGKGSRIGHLNTAVHLDRICLGEDVIIERGNWITGFPSDPNSKHFKHQKGRTSELNIGAHSAITKNHHIDCTSPITIGKFVTIAGYQSQLLTHSIDIYKNRQHSEPIKIGDYCFVGTNVVILGGSSLPEKSVLGAKALLNKKYNDSYYLYGGNPAKPIVQFTTNVGYFNREVGFVD